jgi:acetylornithine/N-succinyldiaminopimelate aminotransferase
MLTTADIAASFGFGAHGSTFGGNPLACAVAGKVLDIVSDPALLADVGRKHDLIVEHLQRIGDKLGIFKQIRGAGLLIGAELIDAWHGKAGEFLAAARAQGLLILMAGPNVLRFTPSLIIPDEDINAGLAKLETAIEQVLAQQ